MQIVQNFSEPPQISMRQKKYDMNCHTDDPQILVTTVYKLCSNGKLEWSQIFVHLCSWP